MTDPTTTITWGGARWLILGGYWSNQGAWDDADVWADEYFWVTVDG